MDSSSSSSGEDDETKTPDSAAAADKEDHEPGAVVEEQEPPPPEIISQPGVSVGAMGGVECPDTSGDNGADTRAEIILTFLPQLDTTYAHHTLNKLISHMYAHLQLAHPPNIDDLDKKIIVQVCQFLCKHALKSKNPPEPPHHRITTLATIQRLQKLASGTWSMEDKSLFSHLLQQQLESEDLNPLQKSIVTSLVADDEAESWHTPIGQLFGFLPQPDQEESQMQDQGLPLPRSRFLGREPDASPSPVSPASFSGSDSYSTPFKSLEEVLAWVEHEYRPSQVGEDMFAYPSPAPTCPHELHLVPPPLQFRADEFGWLDITNPSFHLPIIDETLGVAPPGSQLLNKATCEVLTIPERQLLYEALAAEPRLAPSIHPNRVPKLVDTNPIIAIEVLQNYIDPTIVQSYVEDLLQVETTVHSMDVVNKLIPKLSKDYLRKFVSCCINTCNQHGNDKYMQGRLVRLTCAFFQSVIRSLGLDSDLYNEILVFCLEFSKIKDAANLYRQLKCEM